MAEGNGSGDTGRAGALPASSESNDQLEAYVLRLLDEARDEVKNADSKTNIIFATVTFVVGYLVIIVFLKIVSTFSYKPFVVYRLGLAALVALLLMTGVLDAMPATT